MAGADMKTAGNCALEEEDEQQEILNISATFVHK